jgi:predicted amidohydrolase
VGGDRKMHIGIVQMGLSTKIDRNTQKILNYMTLAAKRRINLLCFPECALTGYIVNHYKIRMDDIRKGISKIQRASDKYGIAAIVGASWQSNNNNNNNKTIYNSAVIIRPYSRIKLYFKNNLTDYDKKYFSKGHNTVAFAVENIRCGVLICRDQDNPLLAARFRKIDILFYLSSHYYTKSEAVKKERKNKAFPIVRALENKVYVAKADAVGKQNSLVNFGSSIVVNSEGEVIAEAKKGRQEMLEFHL